MFLRDLVAMDVDLNQVWKGNQGWEGASQGSNKNNNEQV